MSVDDAPSTRRASYTLSVSVTDNNPDTAADDTILVTVNVGDSGGSNTDPVFPAEAGTFSIDENTTTVQNVGDPVTADDDDNDTLTYTLGRDGCGSILSRPRPATR